MHLKIKASNWTAGAWRRDMLSFLHYSQYYSSFLYNMLLVGKSLLSPSKASLEKTRLLCAMVTAVGFGRPILRVDRASCARYVDFNLSPLLT